MKYTVFSCPYWIIFFLHSLGNSFQVESDVRLRLIAGVPANSRTSCEVISARWHNRLLSSFCRLVRSYGDVSFPRAILFWDQARLEAEMQKRSLLAEEARQVRSGRKEYISLVGATGRPTEKSAVSGPKQESFPPDGTMNIVPRNF